MKTDTFKKTVQRNDEALGTEPVGRLLFRLSIPAIAAQLVNMLYNIVDRIYIGHIPGEGARALTGVGVCLPIIMIISAFAALVSMGGAPRASIFMGKQDNTSAEKTLGNCFVLQLIISAVLTAVVLIWNRRFLLAFGASEHTIGYAHWYLTLYALGTVFVQLTLGMNAFITAQGFALTSMYMVCIGALCNIILDPVFIFGFHLGVAGAAIATVISQGVSAVWVIAFLRGKKTTLRLTRRTFGLSAKIILPCLALGLAPFTMQASESFIFICYNASLLKYGGDIAVGAMSILTSIMQFGLLPLQGLSQGAQPVTSYNFGARNAPRVRKTFRLLFTASLIYAIAIWLLVILFPEMFARIFSSDKTLVPFTAHALRIYCGAMFLFGIQTSCQMTFVAIGSAGSSVIVAVMRKFVLLLPLIYLLPALAQGAAGILPVDQTTAVYFAEPIADVFAVTFTAVLFTVQFRKALKMR
jgi:putative MATE family efflux protein